MTCPMRHPITGGECTRLDEHGELDEHWTPGGLHFGEVQKWQPKRARFGEVKVRHLQSCAAIWDWTTLCTCGAGDPDG